MMDETLVIAEYHVAISASRWESEETRRGHD